MKEIKIDRKGNVIYVDLEKKVTTEEEKKQKKRNFIIRSYTNIGVFLLFFGFLLMVSVEDGLKYFGNSISDVVVKIICGIITFCIGVYMVHDASKYNEEE